MNKINIFEEFGEYIVPSNKSLIESMEFKDNSYKFSNNIDEQIKKNNELKEKLRKMIGKKGPCNETIGAHPDFKNIGDKEVENHYIVSVFLDIKGSTDLSCKLPLIEAKEIKSRIINTTIDIFQAFDAHIHRLQGDAVVAFWGGKKVDKVDAIIDSLNGTSFLQYFYSTTVSEKFKEQGYPPIKIRIGIDFGDDKDVIWSKYGSKYCNEITTTSKHTDLAAKMESKAPPNGTMVGENVIEWLDMPDEFKSIRVNQDGNQEEYIKKDEFFEYEMRVFEWKEYIKSFSMFEKSGDEIKFNQNTDYEIKCFYKKSSDKEYNNRYFSNCGALEKGLDLKFKLIVKAPRDHKRIVWEVNNRGTEAEEAENQLEFLMDTYKNKMFCEQKTSYKGHHYMKCTIEYEFGEKKELYFGVYVK